MNKLILGTVQMGIPYGINNFSGQISQKDSLAILSKARATGICFLDTAEAYGNAHKMIGLFHKAEPAAKFKVITKFPHDFTLEELNIKIEDYLNILELETINTIMFHSFENYKLNKDKISEISKLKESSKVEKIGVSIYTNEQLQEVIEDENIDTIQTPFNLLDNRNKRGEEIHQAKQKNKTIHTRSVFLQGLFFMDRNSDNKIVKALKKELLLLDSLAEKHGLSMTELAMNYCLQQEEIDHVLIGVDSMDHLNQNLGSVKNIKNEIIQEINKINITNFDLLNPSLWK